MAEMTTIHEHAEAMFDFSVERDEWDEIPMVSLTFESGSSEKPFDLHIIAVSGVHPGEFLEGLAVGARRGTLDEGMIPRVPLLGISLQSEGWGMTDPSPEEMAAYRAGTAIEDLPSRVEVKMMVSYDGETIKSWSFPRGGEKVEKPEGMTGRIPDAIKSAFQAINRRAQAEHS